MTKPVLFRFSGFLFLFHSKILDKINYQLNPEVTTPAFTIKKEADKSQFFEAIMIYISEGGIALKGKKPSTLNKGDKLLLWFKPDSWDKEYVKIEGIVGLSVNLMRKKFICGRSSLFQKKILILSESFDGLTST